MMKKPSLPQCPPGTPPSLATSVGDLYFRRTGNGEIIPHPTEEDPIRIGFIGNPEWKAQCEAQKWYIDGTGIEFDGNGRSISPASVRGCFQIDGYDLLMVGSADLPAFSVLETCVKTHGRPYTSDSIQINVIDAGETIVNNGMTLDEYQKEARKTAIYPNDENISYLVLGICGEAGELADKVKKILRDRGGLVVERDMKALALELGDVMWYVANLAEVLGYSLSDIAGMNIEKIAGRVKRGVLHGKGDDR